MRNRDIHDMLSTYKSYYDDNISKLIIFATRFVPDDIAEDITQDLFLDIWNKYCLTNELPTKSYLFTSIKNKCLNILTREKVRRNYIESIELDIKLLGINYYNSQEKLLIDEENIRYIHEEVDKLPNKCRKIFKMSYFEEMKSREIAKKLNISIRTVEHQLYLGLKTLRKRILRNEK